MKFKSSRFPEPSLGVSFAGIKSAVVPDQSLTLQQILDRFTRGEALPVGQATRFGSESDIENIEDFDNPLNVDLEKLSDADLVDKQLFGDMLREMIVRKERADREQGRRDREKLAADQREALEKELRAQIEGELSRRDKSA